MARAELDIRAQIKDLQTGLKKTQTQLKDLQGQSNQTSKTMQQNISGTDKAVNALATSLGALFTVGAAVRFTQAVIQTRKEFETFRAVLTNTLGSAQAANREFAKIQQFARDTPFQVKELTDSFVRLVNQGFKPTMAQMKALGDVAASTGKDFIQLTEAIIDAQVGEFERLKEFGIRASKQGDIVTFTFKEVETQVEFTASAIRDYIVSLGEIEGVTGAMNAISETLEGRLSALEDAWDDLLDTMGGKSQGVFKGVINFFTDLTEKLAGSLKEFDPQTGATAAFEQFRTTLELIADDDRLAFLSGQLDILRTRYAEITLDLREWNYHTLEERQDLFQVQQQLAILIPLYEDLQEQIILGTDDLKKKNEEAEQEVRTIEDVTKEIKNYQDQLKLTAVDNIEERLRIENEIRLRQDLIKEISKQREEHEKLRQELEKSLQVQEEEQLGLENWMLRIKEREEIDNTYFTNWQENLFQQNKADLEAADEAKAINRLKWEGIAEAAMSGLEAINAANKENAFLQQATAISQAIINGALAITKVPTQIPFPASIPFQIALALQTAAQIATIRAQKFAGGHYEVLKGRRHAQGGVDIGIGEAEAGEGVAVFSRQATQKYGKFLPAFVKAMNENQASITGYDDRAYNIHFDDSRQVGKLEDIRKLLSRPDVRYENGYKIIERNGHIQRVKC